VSLTDAIDFAENVHDMQLNVTNSIIVGPEVINRMYKALVLTINPRICVFQNVLEITDSSRLDNNNAWNYIILKNRPN